MEPSERYYQWTCEACKAIGFARSMEQAQAILTAHGQGEIHGAIGVVTVPEEEMQRALRYAEELGWDVTNPADIERLGKALAMSMEAMSRALAEVAKSIATVLSGVVNDLAESIGTILRAQAVEMPVENYSADDTLAEGDQPWEIDEPWQPGDPCHKCGSRETDFDDDNVARCHHCGASDADE